MKKIVYIVKNKLHYYPPCISQIRMLNDLGYNVEVLYGTSNTTILKILEKESIKCKKIPNISDDNSTKFKKVKIWINYRRSMKKILYKYDNETYFWFGTAESVLPLKGLLKNRKYVCFVLELLDEYKFKLFMLKSIMQNAKIVCVCEKTRAYLQKYWWKLKKLPYVFPNKPYKPIKITDDLKSIELENALNQIGDSNYILYQGILQNKEELIEISKALNSTKKHYKFVLMGIDKYDCINEIKKYYNDILYIKYIPAPLHLEITKNAHIGIAYYRDDSLNKAFCAPNKIYEYSGFGVPILSNDIPGLVNTVGSKNAGKCIKLKEYEIIKAINDIDDNYEQYRENAFKFYDLTDNYKTMKELMSKLIEKEDEI